MDYYMCAYMALRIQIAKLKICQYLLRANSSNFPTIWYTSSVLYGIFY